MLKQYLKFPTVGHSSLNTTQIYVSVDNEQLQSAVNSNLLASMFGR